MSSGLPLMDEVERSYLRSIVAARSAKRVLELQAELDAYRDERDRELELLEAEGGAA